MLNLQHLMRAPVRQWEVTMHRRTCQNAAQNARKCVAYVSAIDQAEAMTLANRLPGKQAFKSISAMEVR